MASFALFESESTISLSLAKAEFLLSSEGFQFGISSGGLSEEIAAVANVFREFALETPNFSDRAINTFAANQGIPGTNQQPTFQYLGVYIDGISFSPGSRKLSLSFAVMFHATLSTTQGYPDFRGGIILFRKDLESLVEYVIGRMHAEPRLFGVTEPRIFDVRQSGTLETQAVRQFISGTKKGFDL